MSQRHGGTDAAVETTSAGALGPMRAVGAAALAALVLTLAGCGYSTQAVYPDEYQTVAVPIFENRTEYRRLGLDLSEALVKEIQSETPYAVAPPGSADTILQGVITDARQRQLTRTRRGGVPEEVEFVVTVDLEWRDLSTGETLRDRRGLEVVGRYVPTRPVSQPLELSQHQAAQRLAEQIVSTLRADW